MWQAGFIGKHGLPRSAAPGSSVADSDSWVAHSWLGAGRRRVWRRAEGQCGSRGLVCALCVLPWQPPGLSCTLCTRISLPPCPQRPTGPSARRPKAERWTLSSMEFPEGFTPTYLGHAVQRRVYQGWPQGASGDKDLSCG